MRWLPVLVVLAYVVDAATTLLALDAGGRESNPLLGEMTTAPYLGSVALRAALALGLLAACGRVSAGLQRVVVGGLAALVAVKLVAAASNLAFALGGAPLVGPGDAPALVGVALGVALGASKVHAPRPAGEARLS